MLHDEKNLFKGAKFGDKFLTRSGDLAVFIEDDNSVYKLFIEDYDAVFCDESGRYKGYRDSNLDIVSKYHEEIDEQKLDEFSEDYMDNLNPQEGVDYGIWEIGDAFKAGYRKAKEE